MARANTWLVIFERQVLCGLLWRKQTYEQAHVLCVGLMYCAGIKSATGKQDYGFYLFICFFLLEKWKKAKRLLEIRNGWYLILQVLSKYYSSRLKNVDSAIFKFVTSTSFLHFLRGCIRVYSEPRLVPWNYENIALPYQWRKT